MSKTNKKEPSQVIDEDERNVDPFIYLTQKVSASTTKKRQSTTTALKTKKSLTPIQQLSAQTVRSQIKTVKSQTQMQSQAQVKSQVSKTALHSPGVSRSDTKTPIRSPDVQETGTKTAEEKDKSDKVGAKEVSLDDYVELKEMDIIQKTQEEEEWDKVTKKTSGHSPVEDSYESSGEKLYSVRGLPAILGGNNTEKEKRVGFERFKQDYWPTIKFGFCLCVAVLDPSLMDLLAEYSRAYGGFYFLFLYFVLIWLVQMPLTFLFLHLGYFTQQGIPRIASLFGHNYRSIGYALLAFLIVSQGNLLAGSAEKFDTSIQLSSRLDEFNSCKYVDLECTIRGKTSYCCISLKEEMACRQPSQNMSCPRTIHFGFYLKEPALFSKKTYNKIKGRKDRLDRAPSHFFWRSQTLTKDLTLGSVRAVTMALVVVVCAAMAVGGKKFFMYCYLILGSITIILCVATCGAIIANGNFEIGIRRLARLTKPERFLRIEIIFALFNCICSPVNFKFFVISMATFFDRKNNAYIASITTTMFFIAMSSLFLAMNLAMTGRLEFDSLVYQNIPTSITSVAQKGLNLRREYWANFLPEYFGLYQTKGAFLWIAWIHFLLHFFPIMGTFATAIDIQASYSWPSEIPRWIIGIICSSWIGGALLLVGSLIQVYPNIAGEYYGLHQAIGSTILFLLVILTVRLYSAAEIIIDFKLLYPITDTFHDKIGPLSRTFQGILCVFCPLVLFFTTTIFNYQLTYSFDVEDSNLIGQIFELLIPGIPYFVLLGLAGWDFGKTLYLMMYESKRKEVWRFYHITTEHPSYGRMTRRQGGPAYFCEIFLDKERYLDISEWGT